MRDLKTVFDKPLYPNTTDLGGDVPISRGSDPLVDLGGTSGLQPLWTAQQIVPTPGGEETTNPVSGLPVQPNRYIDSAAPPDPPSLEQRNPGTIDKR